MVAENGLMGVESFKAWDPDLIFMNVRMPVMDGLEASKNIRELEWGSNINIIGISAHVFKKEIETISSVIMDDFIKKTFKFYEIYECLNKYLNVECEFYNRENPENTHLLTFEMLGDIDKAVLINLKKSIISQERNKIKQVLDEISLENKNTGKILNIYVHNLRYSGIYKLINQF